MSAIVRVKRRIDEEPLSGFVLNCKKRKVNGNENNRGENLFETKEEVSTVLKFAGTVESQTEHVVEQINRLTKDEAKSLVKKVRTPHNVTEKNRQEMLDNLHENRFKVVNCYRTINDEETKAITIVDIEKQNEELKSEDETIKKTNESQLPSTSSSNNSNSSSNTNITTDSTNETFVYDLYLPENEEQNDNTNYMDDYTINNISVRPFDDVVYEERYKDQDSDENDSEDSNCEDYYKNDYPDSDDGQDSVGEGDMRRAMQNFGLDGDGDLSSDDETNFNNGFAYSIDAEGIGFEDDIDYCTVHRYGEAYARYKARILKKNKETESCGHDSTLDDNYDSD